jgi:hypothetical protein
MKKVFAMLMVCGLAAAFVACGGGTDKAAAEKAKADSIAVADSLAKVAAEAAAAADTTKKDTTAAGN